MAEVFWLPDDMARSIVQQALAGWPYEVCGIIAGRQGCGVTLYQGRNVAATPRVAFELDTDTLARQIEFADRGLMLAAIYHSHPAGPEQPSASDIAQFYYPDAVALICSTAERAQPVLRGYRISEGQVREVELRFGKQLDIRDANG